VHKGHHNELPTLQLTSKAGKGLKSLVGGDDLLKSLTFSYAGWDFARANNRKLWTLELEPTYAPFLNSQGNYEVIAYTARTYSSEKKKMVEWGTMHLVQDPGPEFYAWLYSLPEFNPSLPDPMPEPECGEDQV
jgi:hypothetical protein